MNVWNDRQIIQDQIEYYRARANEYDEWFYRQGRFDRGTANNQHWFAEVAVVQQALQQVGKVDRILELACGTGIWTQELLTLGNQITAIDASTEVLEINRHKLGASSQVIYQQRDLFTWEPEQQYDLVFFSFWLSHVPPQRLTAFLQTVANALQADGKLFIIDSRFEPTSTANNHVLVDDGNLIKTRKLNDGKEFQIVKKFYQPDELQQELRAIDIDADVKVTERYFIYAIGERSNANA
ncbi:MAG: class I SAM-dependent methyltransferase [Lyngbya sp. HA4199-MV5]|jgi:demethylmenaquinone methyltransferase/2-methoxy-6-polyprenyl-1,4-benzoquinol methylase|nr:class I SAM-dependent methyltransferase [Lyngbya sp. HA4199-MV5]